MIRIEIPLRTVSALNKREHWGARARRVKIERNSVGWMLPKARPATPVRVLMVRIAPRKLDDDNLAGALKGVRDAVAQWLGLDDADPLVTWKCGQEKGKAGQHAVRLEMETI